MKKVYYGSDPALKEENLKAREFTLMYNSLNPRDMALHFEKLKGFLGDIGEGSRIMVPFVCDRGNKIHLGKNVFINYNFTALDMDDIYIGDNVRIAPNVAIYTVWHPLDHEVRNARKCYTDQVYIGDDAWICGNVTILPGVKIGKRAVIGAGSVVTSDIPDDVLAYGNPCRVIRKIGGKDDE